MFIKQLYQHSKLLCILFITFIASFVFINYKWGLVATPILQYGMFSGVYHIKDTQKITQLYINDKVLDYSSYSTAQTDKMTISLSMYREQKKINDASLITMKRVLDKVGIGQLMQREKFTNAVTDEIFLSWYKKLLERITGQKIDKLELCEQEYLWNGTFLAPIGECIKITTIAIN